MTAQYSYRKITSDEFSKLKPLFPDTEEKWQKYSDQQLKQFEERDIDVYAIEHGGEFIGEITAIYSNHTLPTETIPYIRAYFEAFRVREEYQNKGLGQGLMEYAIDDLKKRGYSEFTIGVEEDNEVAKHIYFKLGFTEVVGHGHGNEFDPCDYTLYLKK